MWHDIFGHVPLLIFPTYRLFVERIGKEMLVANDIQKRLLDNIYWYTIEAGVCQEKGQRMIYGASQLSSFGETEYALGDQPTVLPFDLHTVNQYEVNIEEFQKLFLKFLLLVLRTNYE